VSTPGPIPDADAGLARPAGAKQRVLTGVKPTGIPHVGNYLGAIRPAIALANREDVDGFLFIADLHALTAERDPKKLAEDTYSVAATWLALGVDPQRTVFYKQTDVLEVTTLAWILSCFTPMGLLYRGHSVKDQLDNKGVDEGELSHAILSYPVLMAADILLYDADVVPVGKDQKQHLEIAQEIARKVNNHAIAAGHGPVLRVPRAQIDEQVMTIPGLAGRKMSKSYGNAIDLFGTDKALKDRVMSVKTSTVEYGQPLDPEGDVLFALFALLSDPGATKRLEAQYRAARKDPAVADAALADPRTNYFGWGDAKRALLERLLDVLGPARQEYARLMADRAYLRGLLLEGAARARAVAQTTLGRVSAACGFVP
jgi:tryptophanyl-tRNA synthetase